MNDFNSKKYWDDRYRNNLDSGIGSKGVLLKYKADIINDFIKNHNIKTVCELGCGDIQFSLYDIENFTGFDVSDYIVEKNIRDFGRYKFTTSINELKSYDLTMSLDVIYHLMEDDIYISHMNDLFRLSNKYVIIYSPNKDKLFPLPHNRYREFLKDVPGNFELYHFVENPHKGKLTESDFYIFKKMQRL